MKTLITLLLLFLSTTFVGCSGTSKTTEEQSSSNPIAENIDFMPIGQATIDIPKINSYLELLDISFGNELLDLKGETPYKGKVIEIKNNTGKDMSASTFTIYTAENPNIKNTFYFQIPFLKNGETIKILGSFAGEPFDLDIKNMLFVNLNLVEESKRLNISRFDAECHEKVSPKIVDENSIYITSFTLHQKHKDGKTEITITNNSPKNFESPIISYATESKDGYIQEFSKELKSLPKGKSCTFTIDNPLEKNILIPTFSITEWTSEDGSNSETMSSLTYYLETHEIVLG